MDGRELVVGSWGSHSLVMYQAVNQETRFLSVGGKGFFCALFLLLIFIPVSLLETSGSALNLP